MKGRGPQVLGYRMGKGRGQYKEQAQFLKKHQRGIRKGARQVVVRKSCAMGWGTESEASKVRTGEEGRACQKAGERLEERPGFWQRLSGAEWRTEGNEGEGEYDATLVI